MNDIIDPNHMTHDQRHDEVAAILATGILRLHQRQKKAQTIENRELLPLDNRNRMVPYGTPNHIDIEREKP
ncbi:MAG: hypothetical protein HQL87_08500 [Magnetococcales bacterium]|nr:hypothetical protein [Magnetococcales bacterium]